MPFSSEYRKRLFWNKKEVLVFGPSLSRIILQISGDPAFATGMTLMSSASSTVLALLDVKAASRLTFHLVINHASDWRVKMAPLKTNVHSCPSM